MRKPQAAALRNLPHAANESAIDSQPTLSLLLATVSCHSADLVFIRSVPFRFLPLPFAFGVFFGSSWCGVAWCGVADLGLIYEWFYDFSRQLNVSVQGIVLVNIFV